MHRLDTAVGPIVTVAVGSVTAEALTEHGVPVTITPTTYTTGGMFRAIEQWLAARRLGGLFRDRGPWEGSRACTTRTRDGRG